MTFLQNLQEKYVDFLNQKVTPIIVNTSSVTTAHNKSDAICLKNVEKNCIQILKPQSENKNDNLTIVRVSLSYADLVKVYDDESYGKYFFSIIKNEMLIKVFANMYTSVALQSYNLEQFEWTFTRPGKQNIFLEIDEHVELRLFAKPKE